MKEAQMIWSVAEGGTAVLQLPDPMGIESLDLFEEACQIMFRGWRRRALAAEGNDPASIEYRSWLASPEAA